MRKVLAYETNGKCPVEDFFKASNKKIQSKFKYQLDYIKDEHNILMEPHIKHFVIERYKQLYELRIKAAGMMVRVIFHERGNEIILLHAFYKRDRKDTEKALETSLKLLHSLQNSDDIENIVCREMI